MSPVAVNWNARVEEAYANLKAARETGDQLRIDLAENSLNSVMDQANKTLVTRNKGDSDEQ